MEIIRKAQRMLEKYPLCDHCLGRQIAFLGYGMSDQERGKTIKSLLTMEAHRLVLLKDKKGTSLLRLLAKNGSFPMAAQILRKLKRRPREGEKCFLCEGSFEQLPNLLDKAAEMLQDYEYKTFLVGVKLPTAVEEREDEFKAQFEVRHSESIRNEFSRVIGKMLSETVRRPVDFIRPEILVLVKPFTEGIRLQVNSLFIMGRYRKLVRGLPQSKMFCLNCRGKGCRDCNGTGKTYPESVEELIAEPVLKKTSGSETSFHGAGREDMDARMLGQGRPFIIQVKRPHRRKIDLKKLEQEVNRTAEGKIEVKNLEFVDRNAIRKLKSIESSQKTYRVSVKFERQISDKEIGNLQDSLTDVIVIQQTPVRVLHRRADRARQKHIYETRVKRLSPDTIEMRIRCQGGLYIKELVTGDEGRTDPNISAIVDAKAEPLELDVLEISVQGGNW